MTEPKYLTEADMDRIAERAAEKALERVYTQIGKSVVNKALFLIGAAALGFAAAKGWIQGWFK